jgi:hypothetical protein
MLPYGFRSYTERHAADLDQHWAGVSCCQPIQVVAELAPHFAWNWGLGLHHLHARVRDAEPRSRRSCIEPQRRISNHTCRLVCALYLVLRVAAQKGYSPRARKRSAGVGALFSRRRSASLSACISRTLWTSICFSRSGFLIVSAASLFKAERLRCVSLSAS